MGFAVLHWSCLLLHLLVIVLISHGTTLAMTSADRHMHVHRVNDEHDPSSHVDSIFFNWEDLKVGNRIPSYFSKNVAPFHFFPRDEADSIPFSSKQLPSLLKFFSISQGSKQAQPMERTLGLCETPPIKGETKFCATSSESMLEHLGQVFEIDFSNQKDYPTPLMSQVHSTTYNEGINIFQNYAILEMPEEILASKMIGCHSMPYPYTVFNCHTQDGPEAFMASKVLFGGENGDMLDAVVACHMDTSHWNPNHVSFRMLGTELGNPVFYIFPPYANILWAHMPKTSI